MLQSKGLYLNRVGGTGKEVLFTEHLEFINLFYILNMSLKWIRGVDLKTNRHTSKNLISNLGFIGKALLGQGFDHFNAKSEMTKQIQTLNKYWKIRATLEPDSVSVSVGWGLPKDGLRTQPGKGNWI